MNGLPAPVSARSVPVAAIVLNYRNATCTLACLRSIATQGVGRILVWDNSQDEGASARELAQKLADSSPGLGQVEQVISPVNLGFAAGVNAAMRHIEATGGADRILLLNNDAVLPEGAVDRLMSAMNRHEGIAVAAPRVRTAGKTRGLLHHHRWLAIQTSRPLPGSFAYASGCCLLLATKRLPVPVFDEEFFMYSEDVALAWRVHQENRTIALSDDVLVEHAGSSSSKLGSPFYEYQTALGHMLLTQRLAHSALENVLLTFTRGLALVARSTVRTIRSGSLAPTREMLRACIDARARRKHKG